MFFKAHKTIDYVIDGEVNTMTNLTKSSLIINKERSVLKSIVVNSRTPEEVANDEYGDPKLYWTVLYVNNIIDPFTEWYMNDDQLYTYAQNKYGDNIYKIRYFMNLTTRDIITGADADRFFKMLNDGVQLPEEIDSVSNFEHEQNVNQNRNVIKIIPKNNITRFVEQFKKSLK